MKSLFWYEIIIRYSYVDSFIWRELPSKASNTTHKKEHLTPSIFNDDELEHVIELYSKYDSRVRAHFVSLHSSSKIHLAIIQYNIKYTEYPIVHNFLMSWKVMMRTAT